MGYTFNHAHTNAGPVPQNTGVDAIDANVDRVIGADAERGRAVIEQREAHKREVLRGLPSGTKGSKALGRLPNGAYVVAHREDLQSKRNHRAFHNAAMSNLRKDDRFVASENSKFDAGTTRLREFRRQRGRA